jgi:hypothetical protein
MSAVYIKYRRGPKTLPCGTPEFTWLIDEYASPYLILLVLEGSI